MVDEHFNMRFRKDGVGKITPILVATPTIRYVTARTSGPRAVQAHPPRRAGGDDDVVVRRKNGGRVWLTEGTSAKQGNDNYRKAVLNGLLWIAIKVPKNGVHPPYRRGAGKTSIQSNNSHICRFLSD